MALAQSLVDFVEKFHAAADDSIDKYSDASSSFLHLFNIFPHVDLSMSIEFEVSKSSPLKPPFEMTAIVHVPVLLAPECGTCRAASCT